MGRPPQDPPQILGETHVEETVALVDDHHLGLAQRVRALLVVVDQPSRRTDQKIGAPFEDLPLLSIVEAAKDHVVADPRVVAERLCISGNLDGELARRRHDQRPRRLRGRWSRSAENVGEDREQVRSRLSRPGLRLGDDVASIHRQREDVCLDSGQMGEAEIVNRPLDRFREVKLVKGAIGKKGVTPVGFSHRRRF